MLTMIAEVMEMFTFGLTSLGTAPVVDGRLAAEAGRLVTAVDVGILGMGAFLLRVDEVVVVEVGTGVTRLGADAVLDTKPGLGLPVLGLAAPTTGCMEGQQTRTVESRGITEE